MLSVVPVHVSRPPSVKVTGSPGTGAVVVVPAVVPVVVPVSTADTVVGDP